MRPSELALFQNVGLVKMMKNFWVWYWNYAEMILINIECFIGGIENKINQRCVLLNYKEIYMKLLSYIIGHYKTISSYGIWLPLLTWTTHNKDLYAVLYCISNFFCWSYTTVSLMWCENIHRPSNWLLWSTIMLAVN